MNCCCAPDVTRTVTVGLKTKREAFSDVGVEHLCPTCNVKSTGEVLCCPKRKTITRTRHLTTSTTRTRKSTNTSKQLVTSTTAKSSKSTVSKSPGMSSLTLTTITVTSGGTTRTKVTTAVPPKPTLKLAPSANIIFCQTKPASGHVPLVWPETVKSSLTLYIPSKSPFPWTCLVKQSLDITLLYANSSTYSFSSPFNITSGKTALSLGYVDLNGTTNVSKQRISKSVESVIFVRVALPSLSTKTGLPAWQLKEILKPTNATLASTFKTTSQYLGSVGPVSQLITLGIRTILGMGNTDASVLKWFTNVLGVKDTSLFKLLMQVDISIHASSATFKIKSIVGSTKRFSYGMGINATLVNQNGKWKATSRQFYNHVTSPNRASIWNYGFMSNPELSVANMCVQASSLVDLYSLPRATFPKNKVFGRVNVKCTKNVPTQVIGEAALLFRTGKNSFAVNLAPPELKVSDWNTVQNGTIFWNTMKSLNVLGRILGSVMQTHGKEPKTSGYAPGTWLFSQRFHPETSVLMDQILESFSDINSGVALGNVSLTPCGQMGTIIAPCLDKDIHSKQPNNSNPFKNTYKELAKTPASQFMGSVFLSKVVVKYVPGNWTIIGTLDQKIRVEQAWKLPSGTSVTILGYSVYASTGRVGLVNTTLASHPCNGVHVSTFDFRNTTSPFLPHGSRKVSVINTTALVGKGLSHFSCHSNVEALGVLFLVGNLTSNTLIANLYQNATYAMVKPFVEFYSNHSHLDVRSLHSFNSSVAIHVPLNRHDAVYAKRGATWHLLHLQSGMALNQSLEGLLGKPTASKFMASMANTTSRAFHDLLKNPEMFTNVSIGYQKTANLTAVHELFHFGRIGYDRLVGKNIQLNQAFSNFTGVNVSAYPPAVAYQRASQPKLKTTKRIGTPTGFTTTKINTTITAIKGYSSSWDFSMWNTTNTTSPAQLVKRGGSTTTSSTKSSTSTSNTKSSSKSTSTSKSSTSSSVPTYSAAALDSTDLPVTDNNFAYEWTLDDPGTLVVQFTSSYEVCPAGQQSVTGSIADSHVFGNISEFIGRATFVCTKTNEAVSFASQLAAPNMTYTPLNSSIPLNNVSFQTNCVPDSNLCFWPAGASGDALNGLYSFANAMNASTYWSALNISQMLQDAVYGTTDPSQAAEMVQAVLSQYPSLNATLQSITSALPPAFMMSDPLAASLIGQFAFNTPMQSFQCSSDYTKACEYPSIVLAGQINTSAIVPAAGTGTTSNSSYSLMYASVVQVDADGLEIHRQTLAAALGTYGFMAVNLTGDICDRESIGKVSWEVKGFPGLSIAQAALGTASSEEGMVVLDCSQLEEGVINWEFHDSSFPVINMTFSSFGEDCTLSQSDANISYYSSNDTFGVQSRSGNFYYSVQFGGNDPSGTLHITAWSVNATSLSSLYDNNAPGIFNQIFYMVLGQPNTKFKSFTNTTILKSFYADYDSESYQGALQVSLQTLYGQTLIDATVFVNMSFGDPYKTVSDSANILIVLGATSNNFLNLTAEFVPCSVGSTGTNPGLSATADYNFALPAGVGVVSGQAVVSIGCSGSTTNSFSATGEMAGPIQLELFGDSIQVNAANFSLTQYFLEIYFETANSQLTGQFHFTQEEATVEAIFINAPGPISPLNSSLPYSTYWNSIMSDMNVDVMISNFYLNYAYDQDQPHLNIMGTIDVGPFEASVDMSFNMAPPSYQEWTLTFFNVSLVFGDLGSVVMTGANEVCGNDTVSTYNGIVILNPIGPLAQTTTLMATIDVMCNDGNISYYTVEAEASDIKLTYLGSTAYTGITINFNSSDTELFLNMTGSNWIGSLNANVKTATYTFDVSSMAPVAFVGLPFGSGLSTALSSTAAKNVTSLTLEFFMMQGVNTAFNFSATVAETASGFTAGEALDIQMEKSGSEWILLDSDFIFTAALQIGSYGQVIVAGELVCPVTTLTSSVTLSGMKEFGQISSTGTINYYCGAEPWWNTTVSLKQLQITALGEVLSITDAVLLYSNETKVLELTGSVAFGSLTGTVSLVYNMSHSNTLEYLQLQVIAGVGLFNPDLPFGDSFAGAVSASPNEMISPMALLAESTFVWNYSTNTMTINAAIQDGSLSGLLNLSLLNVGNNTTPSWEVTEAQIYVAIEGYGNLLLSGNAPCGNDSFFTITSELDLPIVGPQNLQGDVEFICNGSSIESYTATLTDDMTFALFGTSVSAEATLVYESAESSLQVSATFEPNITLEVNYETGTFEFMMQVNSPTGWDAMPYGQQVGGWVDSADLTTSPTTSYPMQFAQLNYTSATNKSDSLNFTCAFFDSEASASGMLSVITDFVGNGSSTSWTLKYGVALITIMVNNLAQLTLELAPECSASGVGPTLSAYISLFNLPLSIPNFAFDGSVTFGCNGTKINYNSYTVTAPVPKPPPLKFLGDTVQMPNMNFVYSSFSDVFSLTWPTLAKMNFNVSFGQGLPSSGSGGSSGSSGSSGSLFGGLSFTGSFPNPGPMLNAISAVSQSIPSISSLTSLFTTLSSSTPESLVLNDLNAIHLPSILFTFNEPQAYFEIEAIATFYNITVDLFLFAPKPKGSSAYNLVFGVTLDGTENFDSGMTWLDGIFNGAAGLQFSDVVFCLSTGAGIFTLSSGQEITTYGPGLLIQGAILMGSIQFATNSANTGSFGTGLQASSGNGVAMEFVFDLTDTQLSLTLELTMSLSGGSNSEYLSLGFVIQSIICSAEDPECIPQVEFAFWFTYSTVWGGDPLAFAGEFGVQFNELGGTAIIGLGYQGVWNNPFQLSQDLTVNEMMAEMGFNLETLVPTLIDISIGAQIDNPVTQVSSYLYGELLFDIAEPLGSSAVALNVTNWSMATIVNLFYVPPSWAQNMLKLFSVTSAQFSWNPSDVSVGFQVGTLESQTIPPGLYVYVTNFQYYGLILVQEATFTMAVTPSLQMSASLTMEPIYFGQVFTLTAIGDTSKGPNGSFSMTDTLQEFEATGQINLFGGFNVDVEMTMSTNVESGETDTSLSGTWTYYGDTVTLTLSEIFGGYSSGSWLFLVEFELNTTYGGGFFEGLFDGFSNQTQSLLSTMQSSVLNYVNQQAADAIQIADDALQSAIDNLAAAEADVNSAIQGAVNQVNKCQNTVNSWQSTCNNYNHHCKWWEAWNCVA
jgi:hypothetical protein